MAMRLLLSLIHGAAACVCVCVCVCVCLHSDLDTLTSDQHNPDSRFDSTDIFQNACFYGSSSSSSSS